MTDTTSTTRAVTYRRVLANPRFRLLLGTRSLAVAADELRTVALSVLVFALTHSALLAALAYGISFLPQVVGGAFLGALSDRVRPRPVIVTAYTAECGVSLALASGRLPVSASLALVAGIACLTPVFAGASARVTAEVLTGEAYVTGRSLSNIAASAAQLIGLAGGGIAVAALGARGALLAASASHLVAAVAIRVRLPDLPAAARPPVQRSRSVLRQSWSGNRQLIADPAVRILLLAQWLPPAFISGAEGLIIPYAAARGFPASSPGLLLACLPVGMIAGNLAVTRLLRPARRERSTVPLVALCGLPLVAFAASPPPVAAAGLLMITGIGLAYGLGIQRRFFHAVPETVRGQAFGLLSTGLMTLQGVGPTVFGALAQAAPVGVAMALAGAATLLTALFLWARLPLTG
jgi:predicted MFS family arabinose efflux permease